MLATHAPLVLLQTSDWHVGSPLTGRGLGLSPEARSVRVDEVDGAAERAVATAISVGAEALLVPGDLWDAESVPPDAIHRIVEALASFAPRPVFIAPGNHDFCGAAGWYDPAVLSALGMRAWPENVIVFKEPGWTVLPFPGRDDVMVAGRAFLSPQVSSERPLARPPARPRVPLALLLVHGSYESYGGPDAAAGDKKTAPFSRHELLAAGFTWAALGHHHHAQVVEDESGVARGAYAGCPTGRGFDEARPRVFLKVTIREGVPTVDRLPADTRTIHDLHLDVGDLDAPGILGKAEALFAAQAVAPSDVVRLTLHGVQAYGARPLAALAPLTSRVFHLVAKDQCRPPHSLEPPNVRTAEGRFEADLIARREKAPDEAARRVIDLALRLGRDALAGRAIRPPETEEG